VYLIGVWIASFTITTTADLLVQLLEQVALLLLELLLLFQEHCLLLHSQQATRAYDTVVIRVDQNFVNLWRGFKREKKRVKVAPVYLWIQW
jgi:hypothetical protein